MFAPKVECAQQAHPGIFEYSAQGTSTPKESIEATGVNCLNAEFSALTTRSNNNSLNSHSPFIDHSKGNHFPESMVDPFSSAAQQHLRQPYTSRGPTSSPVMCDSFHAGQPLRDPDQVYTSAPQVGAFSGESMHTMSYPQRKLPPPGIGYVASPSFNQRAVVTGSSSPNAWDKNAASSREAQEQLLRVTSYRPVSITDNDHPGYDHLSYTYPGRQRANHSALPAWQSNHGIENRMGRGDIPGSNILPQSRLGGSANIVSGDGARLGIFPMQEELGLRGVAQTNGEWESVANRKSNMGQLHPSVSPVQMTHKSSGAVSNASRTHEYKMNDARGLETPPRQHQRRAWGAQDSLPQKLSAKVSTPPRSPPGWGEQSPKTPPHTSHYFSNERQRNTPGGSRGVGNNGYQQHSSRRKQQGGRQDNHRHNGSWRADARAHAGNRARSGSVGSSTNTDADPDSGSSLLEQYKNDKSGKEWKIKDIQGEIGAFARDRRATRFLQRRIETATDMDMRLIYTEVVTEGIDLMLHKCGNYVIKKMYEHCPMSFRRGMTNTMVGNVLLLAQNVNGCRVLQSAIEFSNDDAHLATVLSKELSDHIDTCACDSNATHVLQKCLTSMSCKNSLFIAEALEHFDVLSLAKHQYGCHLLQRCIATCSGARSSTTVTASTEQFVSRIDHISSILVKQFEELAFNRHGNFVLQYVLEHGSERQQKESYAHVLENVVRYSMHKFASHLVEQCLKKSTFDDNATLIENILKQELHTGESGVSEQEHALRPAIVCMMRDPYANFVVQKVFDFCSLEQRSRVYEVVTEHSQYLKKSTYARHILLRIEQQMQ
jgi:hypothetical protein